MTYICFRSVQRNLSYARVRSVAAVQKHRRLFVRISIHIQIVTLAELCSHQRPSKSTQSWEHSYRCDSRPCEHRKAPRILSFLVLEVIVSGLNRTILLRKYKAYTSLGQIYTFISVRILVCICSQLPFLTSNSQPCIRMYWDNTICIAHL